ncbi:MAG: flagellar biosynthesis protein [Bacteroidota bacterium]
MNNYLKLAATIGVVVAITAGCATNRSELQLSAPSNATTKAAAPKGVNVIIRSVKDDRLFENAPSDPSTPSLGLEGSSNATQELKSRAVARKRNGFGKAMGDVVLQDGQTVSNIVRSTLSSAFEQAGYKVTTEAAAGTPALFVDVRIKKFWAWMTPGFWALTFESQIETDLNIEGRATPISIKAYATDSRQLGTDSTWMDIINQGLKEFQTQATQTASALP